MHMTYNFLDLLYTLNAGFKVKIAQFTYTNVSKRALITTCSFAQRLERSEVCIFDVEFHIVPIIDGYASVRLRNMMEPQRWQIQYVTSFEYNS